MCIIIYTYIHLYINTLEYIFSFSTTLYPFYGNENFFVTGEIHSTTSVKVISTS